MKQGGKIRLSVGRTGPCTPRTRYFSPLQAFSLRCGQGRIPLPLLFPRSAPFSAGKRGRPRPARPAFCPEDTEKKTVYRRPDVFTALGPASGTDGTGRRRLPPRGIPLLLPLTALETKAPASLGAGQAQVIRSSVRKAPAPWGDPAGKNAATEKSPAEARFPSLYKREEKIRQTPPPISPKRPALQKKCASGMPERASSLSCGKAGSDQNILSSCSKAR